MKRWYILVNYMLIIMTLQMFGVLNASALRQSISMDIAVSTDKGIVTTTIGRLVDADLTLEYEAHVALYEDGTLLAEDSGVVNPGNPRFEQTSENSLFRLKFIPERDDPNSGIVKVLYQRYHADLMKEYKGEIKISQGATMLLNSYATGRLGAYCIDNDGDGYGDGPGCLAPDCDEGDPTINPGAIEASFDNPVCNDGKDNDCDNLIDADDPECQECTPGTYCNDGNPCTRLDTCQASGIFEGIPLLDRYEPNDNRDNATTLTSLNSHGDWVSTGGNLNPAFDEDWFRVNIAEGDHDPFKLKNLKPRFLFEPNGQDYEIRIYWQHAVVPGAILVAKGSGSSDLNLTFTIGDQSLLDDSGTAFIHIREFQPEDDNLCREYQLKIMHYEY